MWAIDDNIFPVCLYNWQKSFFRRLTNEKQSETFYKVFYDRIQDAQQSIKASVAANADESLANTENVDNKDDVKHEAKRKGCFCFLFNMCQLSCLLCIQHGSFFCLLSLYCIVLVLCRSFLLLTVYLVASLRYSLSGISLTQALDLYSKIIFYYSVFLHSLDSLVLLFCLLHTIVT